MSLPEVLPGWIQCIECCMGWTFSVESLWPWEEFWEKMPSAAKCCSSNSVTWKKASPKGPGHPSPRTSNMLQFETDFSKSRHFPQECILYMKHHETTTQTRRGWTLISSHSSVASYGMGRSLAGIVPEVINNTNPLTNYHHWWYRFQSSAPYLNK